ncbi:MAG: hypothetical protein K2K56_10670 [Lachnospiraceae bacterium]|nr:hypothetical protein [Lachnospiraceae bacterium]
MNYEILHIISITITYVVIGVLTAALAGLMGYVIWLFLTKKTEKYYIKNAMHFLRLVLICFIAPLIPFVVSVFLSRVQDRQIVTISTSMLLLTLPAFVLWLYKMGPVLRECRQRHIGVRELCKENMPVEEEEIYAILDKWKKRLKFRRRIEIFYNAGVTSPAVIYYRGYKLLLPVYGLQREELNIAILHELVHCRHHDLPVKNLALVANVIHCFHPIGVRLRRDIDRWAEVDCDFSCCEMGKEEFSRKEYFQCILALRARGIEYLEVALSEEENKSQQCSLYEENSSRLQFRVDMMHKMERDYVRIPIGSFMLTVVLAILLTVGTWETTVHGMEFWYRHTLTYEKVEVKEPQTITDMTAEEFFEGTEVIHKGTDSLKLEESTELTVGPGETWIFDVSREQSDKMSMIVECGQQEPAPYRAGYIDDGGRLVYVEGDNEGINAIFETEDEGSRIEQVVIQNRQKADMNIGLTVGMWK